MVKITVILLLDDQLRLSKKSEDKMKAINLKNATMVVDGVEMDCPVCKDARLTHVTYYSRLRKQLANAGKSLDRVVITPTCHWIGNKA